MNIETNDMDQFNIKSDRWKNDEELFSIVRTELYTAVTVSYTHLTLPTNREV